MKPLIVNPSIDTIAAIATPPGRGGVGIVRISGPLVCNIAQKILGKDLEPRYANFGSFFNEEGQSLDEGIALLFVAPHSFTGEDVLELQAHGGPIILDQLLQRVLQLGARLARPGEFTERAFLNDKIDLAQAEAVADLIDANSVQAARSALRSLRGEFSQKINLLTEQIIHLRMYVEAAIDFPEEEIDFLSDGKVLTDLNQIIHRLEEVFSATMQGVALREGLTAVIIGKPNAGKSSLLNALSGEERAIVTEIPGTTRDVLKEMVLIDGIPLHLIDTAGIRDTQDVIEREGIERAKKALHDADLILAIQDSNEEDATISDEITQILQKMQHKHYVLIKNKIDLSKQSAQIKNLEQGIEIYLSAKTKEGIDLLKQHLKSLIGAQNLTEGLFTARRRHINALEKAKTHLHIGKTQLTDQKAGELLAEELRQAHENLSEITGEFYPDDLLGRIFGQFCIGK